MTIQTNQRAATLLTLTWLICVTVYQVKSQATPVVTYNATTTTIICSIQVDQPVWTGPHPNTFQSVVYFQQNQDKANSDLGEKSSRLLRTTDKRGLIINDTRLSDFGNYTCKQTYPFEERHYNLLVRVRPDHPDITTSVQVDNNGVRATEGLPLTVTCTSRGGYPVPTVAWYKGTATDSPLAQTNMGTMHGETFTVTLVYTFNATRQDDRQPLVCRSYWPTPADAQGSLEKNVSLYLYLKPFQPTATQSTSVVAGDNVNVQCRTNGSRPAAYIFWKYQDQLYTPTVQVTNDTADQTFTTVSMLRLPVTAVDNGLTVQCIVSHTALGSNLTAKTLMNVQFPVGRSTTNITGNKIVVADGRNRLILNCTSGSSNPPADITWRNGTNEISNNNGYTNSTGTNNGLIRSQILPIIPTRYDHGDRISCSASNGVEQVTDTKEITLVIHFTPIVTISTKSSITLNEQPSSPPTVLPCSADSNPNATITWYHNSQVVATESTGSSLSYTIMKANRTSYGNYTCTAVNKVPPGDSKTYTVNVLFPPLEVSIDQPTGDFIANGQNTMLINCTSGTSNPVSEISWNTSNIQTNRPSHVDSPGAYGGSLRISMISFQPTRDFDGAIVQCAARNNVTGQHEVSRSTVIDNIIYHPRIADIPVRNVTEGDSVTLPCHASSKPPANFTWRKGSTVLKRGLGTVQYNGINYTIHNVLRTHAGTYNCSADNQVQPIDNKQTLLTVLYPPNVTVIALNKTVNSSETTVTCVASGVPDQYTYGSWVHTWNGHVVKHPVPLPATRVLTLTGLSYAHSGVYTCKASNGVKGDAQGNGSLLVKSPPIVVGDVANRMEIKASGPLMKAITATFHYYSNAGQGSVTVQKTNGTGEEDIVNVELRDVVVRLPMFLSEINTSGTEATINITLTSMSQFGSYDVFVKNKIDRVQLSLIIKPIGPPERPVLVNSTVLDHQTVTIMWISGFPNGLKQTFVIQLSRDKSTWWNITQYGGMVYQQKHTEILDNLASRQLYYVRMLAFNSEGESELSNTLNFTTAAKPNAPATPPVALIAGGAVGGVVAAAVVIVIIILVVWRRKALHMQGRAKDEGTLVMASNHNEGYDNGDEEVINRLYESAGVTETVVGASTSKQALPSDVGNIYAKVNKKPEVVYAMPDNRKGKKLERQQNKSAIKTQKGDVYENTPSIMPGEHSAHQSGESVYEDTCISARAAPKKTTRTDGLLYADLEFAPRKKAQTKIIGIEDRCEYTTIDHTKKAQPLPDSDGEDKINTNT